MTGNAENRAACNEKVRSSKLKQPVPIEVPHDARIRGFHPRELTDEEIKQLVDRLKFAGPRAFMADDLNRYIASEDHDWLIRSFEPFVDCTLDVLKHNFPSVKARFREMRQRCHILVRKQVQELVDLMRSSETECPL